MKCCLLPLWIAFFLCVHFYFRFFIGRFSIFLFWFLSWFVLPMFPNFKLIQVRYIFLTVSFFKDQNAYQDNLNKCLSLKHKYKQTIKFVFNWKYPINVILFLKFNFVLYVKVSNFSLQVNIWNNTDQCFPNWKISTLKHFPVVHILFHVEYFGLTNRPLSGNIFNWLFDWLLLALIQHSNQNAFIFLL